MNGVEMSEVPVSAIGGCAARDPAITSPAVNNETCDVGLSVARMRFLPV